MVGISEKVLATVEIGMYNTDSIVCIIRRGKVARKFCGAACRPRVENYFDLERTHRVIFLFGINFMLVSMRSSDGVRIVGLSRIIAEARNVFVKSNFIDRIQF